MNEQRRPIPAPPSVIETLEASVSDLAAGRCEDLDGLLARMDARIAKRTAEIERDRIAQP